MAGLFLRVKVWITGETVNTDDLNAEFNNIFSNVDASHAEGTSQTLSQMQATDNPGGVGSEVLTQPISQAQENRRLRYVINRIIGGLYWYSTPDVSLNALNTTVKESLNLPNNRIVSGRINGSNQPDFIRANTTSVKLLCTATPFICVINGIQYTFSSDIILSGLSAGYTSQHTALNGDTFTGGEDSKVAGESISLYQFGVDRSFINIGTVGSQITTRVGQIAAMKIVNGAAVADYFLCRIGTVAHIDNLFRGFFVDTSGSPTPQAVLVTGETITLLKLTYLFLNTSGVLIPIYNEPFYQPTTPASFSTGDYWFDTSIQEWKTYNGAAWINANALLVGICAQDSTGCIVSRSGDLFREFSNTNEISVGTPPASGSIIYSNKFGGKISVYGNEFSRINDWTWDLTANIDTGLTAAAGVWYLYVTDTGGTVLSTVHPNDRFGSLSGFYHPAKPWRCVGFANAATASTWAVDQAHASLRSISLDSVPDESISINNIAPRLRYGAYGPISILDVGGFAISGPVNTDLATDQGTTSATPVAINNMSVTLAVTGLRPVAINFQAPEDLSISSNRSGFNFKWYNIETPTAVIFILRNGTPVARYAFSSYMNAPYTGYL